MADTGFEKPIESKTQTTTKINQRAGYHNKTPPKSIIALDINKKCTSTDRNCKRIEDDEIDDLVAKFEEYGNTPPRTRMKIKIRDWDRKQRFEIGLNAAKKTGTAHLNGPECNVVKRGLSRLCRSRIQRRNTMDCAILNEIFIDEEAKRTDKRAQALLRESERDMKRQSMIAPGSTKLNKRMPSFHESRTQSGNNNINNTFSATMSNDPEQNNNSPCILRNRNSGVPTLIESCNRYMSVTSRPVGCRVSAPPLAFSIHSNLKIDNTDSTRLQSRKEFHETFANLIKLGNIDRQEKLSNEDHNWQTELKDLIWLELQAWQADRTLEQQDKYLFTARQGVPELLNQILNYRFRPKYKSETSVISTDSGFGSEYSNSISDSCSGCLSLYCKHCSAQQSHALKEIEELLTRLEVAEALYPSSQQMGVFHPIYKSESFVGRVKAMCLWYNITRHHRLKLIILGKLLARLQGEKFNWPVQTSVTESSSSSGQDNDSGKNSVDPKNPTKVKFNIKETTPPSPTESTSTENSIGSEDDSSSSNQSDGAVIGEYTKSINEINIFNVEPLIHITYDNVEHSTKLYRKYIENVLKSRGLAKSLAFLHQLHNIVLYKAKISLEKLGTEEYDSETDIFDDDNVDENSPQLEPYINQEQIEELRRYGHWSPEATSIGLPSYVPTFVFLSVIPLEVIHEFLRMRMETRPAKPNPLSLEQLMKELKEGLILALTHRERFSRHITTALSEKEKELEKYLEILDQFDSTVKKVFELYLDYIDQWVLVAAPETHQKSALEKEWVFIKLVSPMIPSMHILAAKKFCLIISNLLHCISNRLVSRCLEFDEQIEDASGQDQDDAKKWQLLKICRETQALFTVEREVSVKLLFFAKSFCRDVEQPAFHRDHEEEYLSMSNEHDFVCPAINEAFTVLQKDVLDVRNKLIKIIERVQDRCNIKNMLELDEQDKIAILSRSREILHQGYKFGFEYNKDVIRLFEQKIMSCKEVACDLDLSLGIIRFAKMWIQFVNERCERGRGVRPRWASQGLEFLILACDPQISRHLDEKQFEDLKKKMDCCISHVIGVVSEPEKIKKKASPRTRKSSSPAASRSRTPTRAPMSAGIVINANQKFLLPQLSLKEEISGRTEDNNNSSVEDSTDFHSNEFNVMSVIVPKLVLETPALRQIRVRDAVNCLDLEIENKLREKNLIGQVKALNSYDKIQIRARSVNFRWHRGIKIGQGRFGKVYTAVNNTNGELMAMKEIAIQPGETRAIRNVAEELKILEGINHRNLVKYYGIEIHREELLIFMELCSEGTLESLVELSGGLHEGLTRRFTAQMLSGVVELHKHGIVHRDIKTANIFLFDGGSSLKLGDFGSAIKIQAHTTLPGELQGYVGTQAYMAPEVFTKTNSDGHGRAADIWSVGCVVIEMVSGKRPWSQFDSNYQIMFKVGMGEAPEIPQTLSQEGSEFLENCLQHDPKLRMTGLELVQHNFCKVEVEEVLNKDLNRVKLENQGRKSLRRSRR